MEAFNEAFEKLTQKFQAWLEQLIIMLPNFIVAVLVVVLFYALASALEKILAQVLSRFSRNKAINRLIQSLIRIFMYVTGLIIALSVLNLDKTVSSLLAGVGIIGLVLGLAFKNAAANLFSGVYLAIKSPINVGDLISTNNYYGHITKIGLRATYLKTLQGQEVILPNQEVIDNPYTHYTLHKKRRIDLPVGISYGDDLNQVEQVTLEAVKGIDGLLDNPKPQFYYTEFGNSSINFTLMYWIRFYDERDYLHAMSQGIKKIKAAYDTHGITITFPIRTLDFGIKGGKTLADMLNQVNQIKTDQQNFIKPK